jgi:hypothetical protein
VSLPCTAWDEVEGSLDRKKFIGHVEHNVVISFKSFLVFNYFFSQNITVSKLDCSSENTLFDDALLFYWFYSQGAQAVGMGKEAQNVPTAADLYMKANDILG